MAAAHPLLNDELVLPRLDLRAVARRAAPVLGLGAAAALTFGVAGGALDPFADALSRALDADARWLAAAVAFELLSFVGYIGLLWFVGARASARLDLRASTQITLGGAAATRLLPTAGVGGAAVTLWALRRAGLGARDAARTLLGFLVVLYAVFLGAIAVAGALLATGAVATDAPLALTLVPAVAAGVAIVAALGLAARAPGVGPARLRAAGELVGGGVRDALGLVRSGDPRLLGALAWWAFDAAVLLAMLHAFGTPPALAVVVFAYFVGQIANTLPVPGAASGGLVGVLLAFGLAPALVVPAVLAYRAIAIWLPAPAGLVALGGLRRTLRRWSTEDGR